MEHLQHEPIGYALGRVPFALAVVGRSEVGGRHHVARLHGSWRSPARRRLCGRCVAAKRETHRHKRRRPPQASAVGTRMCTGLRGAHGS
eukprot:701549-Prymnesium_polylepis.1